MENNYKRRLEQLYSRRYNEVTQRRLFSESFNDPSIGDRAKYVFESMLPVEPNYTMKTMVASDKVETHLKREINQSISFEYQGSVTTDTHIKIHSDIDLLVIIENFYSLETPQIPVSPYLGNPCEDMKSLRVDCYSVLNNIYKEVDNSNSKSIAVELTSPKRKVDVVVCNWFNSNTYKSSNNPINRGIQLYDKKKDLRENPDYPFLHIKNVNDKGENTSGGFKKLVRLLKTLKVDTAGTAIKLSSFKITGLLYDIPNEYFNVDDLKLLHVAKDQLYQVITNDDYREQIKSPNHTEYVFGKDGIEVTELKKLLLEVEEIIQDVSEELQERRLLLENKFYYSTKMAI